MTDDFAEGWMEFQSFVDSLRIRRNLTKEDIKEYFKMYKEDMEQE